MSDNHPGLERCSACGKASGSVLKCSGCRLVGYCGKVCQGNDWSQHKQLCKEKRNAARDVMLFQNQEGNHFGSCPICLLPMLFDADRIMEAEDEEYYHFMGEMTSSPCCWKVVCTTCFDAHIITRIKEQKTPTCPFCRCKTPDTEKDVDELLKLSDVQQDNPALLLKVGALHYSKGNHGEAFNSYKKAAKLGNAQGMYFVSTMLHCGVGVTKNHGKAAAYVIRAAAGGHPIARYEAAMIELSRENTARAVKHFCIAASQGVTKSLEELKIGYRSGYVTKSEYEKALRTNQQAKEAMKDNEESRQQMLAEVKRQVTSHCK